LSGANLTIRLVYFHSVPTGLDLEGSVTRALVDNCTFRKNGYGVFLGGEGSHHVKNCTFLENVIAGVRIDSFLNIITGNLFEDNAIGINVSTPHPGNTASHNHFLDSQEYGIKVIGKESWELSAENNWWGDNSGPYHQTDNPGGLGDNVTDLVDYRNFLP